MKFRLLAAAVATAAVFFFASRADAREESELFQAVQFQDVEAVKSLLAKGADANEMAGGRPLLGWAAQNGNTQIVEALLKAGAKPNVADEGVGHTPLMRAIDTHQPGAILLLLKAKADPNAKTPEGKSCLMMAVESRKPKVVQALIVAGADVKYVTKEGESAALTAAQDGMEESYEIIKILGNAKAEMNASNAAYTPLTYAIEQNNLRLVTALLEAGADPNAATQSGRTPLSAAAYSPEIVQLLLNAKADPNKKNGSGDTPLAEAIYNDKTDVAKMLLAAGADPKNAGPNGLSALEYAKQFYRNDIVALLEPAKAAAPGKEDEKLDPALAERLAQIKCTIIDAAKMQMLLHESLQDQVALGNMDSEIFRTFGEDTKEYGEVLTSDPSEACRMLERLASKYGVESPMAKLNRAAQ